MELQDIVLKIKYLMRLAKSANENEAANALFLAKKLMEKHGLLEADVEEKEEKPIYTDEQMFHNAVEPKEWEDILAVAVADKYECYVIKEKCVTSSGDMSFKYFAYGDDADIIFVKAVFNHLFSQMVSAISMNCRDRGELYVDSYSEGLVSAVRTNIMFEDFNMPGLVEVKAKEDDPGPALVKTEEVREKPPIEEKTQTRSNKKEKPLDIMAYFKGEGDGRDIHLNDDGDYAPNELVDGIDLSHLFDDGGK
jgi:hypothetical protein